MDNLIKTEAQISAYQIDIFGKDSDVESGLIPRIFKGNCNGTLLKGESVIYGSSEDMVFRVTLCKD